MSTPLEQCWEEFLKSLPETHWARYDLTAVRLGWDAAHEAVSSMLALVLDEKAATAGFEVAREAGRQAGHRFERVDRS